jgi:hypothetical protein
MFYNAIKAAAENGPLTRGSIGEALSKLDIPSDGLGPEQFTFDPNSLTPGVPDHADTIVTADPATEGFLKVVKPWFVSDLIDEYYQSKQ